jgi:hypothetical protein
LFGKRFYEQSWEFCPFLCTVTSSGYITLSTFAERIRDAIYDVFANTEFWVLAEVTNYSFYSQKSHHYFDLVEKSKVNLPYDAVVLIRGDGPQTDFLLFD